MPAISRLDCVSESRGVSGQMLDALARLYIFRLAWLQLPPSAISAFEYESSQSFGTSGPDPFEGESNMCKSNLQGLNYFKIVKEAKIGI